MLFIILNYKVAHARGSMACSSIISYGLQYSITEACSNTNVGSRYSTEIFFTVAYCNIVYDNVLYY